MVSSGALIESQFGFAHHQLIAIQWW